jgi:hypothetical protein
VKADAERLRAIFELTENRNYDDRKKCVRAIGGYLAMIRDDTDNDPDFFESANNILEIFPDVASEYVPREVAEKISNRVIDMLVYYLEKRVIPKITMKRIVENLANNNSYASVV